MDFIKAEEANTISVANQELIEDSIFELYKSKLEKIQKTIQERAELGYFSAKLNWPHIEEICDFLVKNGYTINFANNTISW
jgi:hypothetical protein